LPAAAAASSRPRETGHRLRRGGPGSRGWRRRGCHSRDRRLVDPPGHPSPARGLAELSGRGPLPRCWRRQRSSTCRSGSSLSSSKLTASGICTPVRRQGPPWRPARSKRYEPARRDRPANPTAPPAAPPSSPEPGERAFSAPRRSPPRRPAAGRSPCRAPAASPCSPAGVAARRCCPARGLRWAAPFAASTSMATQGPGPRSSARGPAQGPQHTPRIEPGRDSCPPAAPARRRSLAVRSEAVVQDCGEIRMAQTRHDGGQLLEVAALRRPVLGAGPMVISLAATG